MDYIMTLESYMIEDATTDNAMESFRYTAMEIFDRVRDAIRNFIDWIKSKLFSKNKGTSNVKGSKNTPEQERLNKEAQKHVSTTLSEFTKTIDAVTDMINTYANALTYAAPTEKPTGADEIAILDDVIRDFNIYADKRKSDYESKYSTASLADIGPSIRDTLKNLVNKLNKLDRSLAFVVRNCQAPGYVPGVQNAANQIAVNIGRLISTVRHAFSYYEKKI